MSVTVVRSGPEASADPETVLAVGQFDALFRGEGEETFAALMNRLAEDLGLQVVEQSIPRELLYLADELFFTGTAAEITPIASPSFTM